MRVRVFLFLFMIHWAAYMFAQDPCVERCEILQHQYNLVPTKNLKKIEQKRNSLKALKEILKEEGDCDCGFDNKIQADIQKINRDISAGNKIFAKSEYETSATDIEVRIPVKQGSRLKNITCPTWLTLEDSIDNNSLVFTQQENTSVYERTGIVEAYVGDKRYTCTITQAAAPIKVNITEHLGFGKDGGISYVFVETNDTAWTVSGEPSWIHTKLANYGVRVQCDANPAKKARSASLRVDLACGKKSQVVKVDQAIGRTTLSVPNKSVSFGNDDNTRKDVTVICNYDQWSVSTKQSWIKANKKYGGIYIECNRNPTASSRTGIVHIETNDEYHLVEDIVVTQKESPAYISAEKNYYNASGNYQTFSIPISTNVLDWTFYCSKGNSWTTIKKQSSAILKVILDRNDLNSSRTAEIVLVGKDKTYTISLTQPNRGYAGRYNDYFDANGSWRMTWFSIDLHGMTTIGNNISLCNVRWKPVEISLININIDYLMENGVSANWEPVVRGFLPVSRNGKWAAFAGLGAHVCMTGGSSHFLFEIGMERQWNSKYSSRIFFKYNGAAAIGMSFDIGKWY